MKTAQPFRLARLVALLALGWMTSAATPPHGFPIGRPKQIDELPAGHLRTRLESLPVQARDRAIRWLASFHFSEADLPSIHADAAGGIYYVCPTDPTIAAETVPVPIPAEAAVPISPFPSHLVFHSRPGAPNILFLNFSGEEIVNTEWNNLLDRDSIPALPFSTDSDRTTFSDAEQTAIKRIWQRVAEDYAPFNIDVTTERPASFNNQTAMALITSRNDANGDPNPHNTAGGVSYVNVFNTFIFYKFRPAWIYHDNLSNYESYIAEAASHEIGHNLGLSHDGKTDGTEYYGGHGTGEISWGPIMGLGYNRNVSQWSKGDYYNANNTEDDLATIAGKVAYLTDDHGNSPTTATALIVTGGTQITATTPETDPHNVDPTNKGILERNTDVDVFSFVTGSGPVTLWVDPWIAPSGTRGGNLDIAIDLFGENGLLIQSDNPADQTGATIQATLPQGRYFLHIRNSGTGDPFSSSPTGYVPYASIGQYFIRGTVLGTTTFVAPPQAELQVSNLTLSGQTDLSLFVTYSDDTAVDITTLDANDLRVRGPNGYEVLAEFISVDTTVNGTPRTAAYAIAPPSGSTWLPIHNGTYQVYMEPEQVADVEGAFVAEGELGGFEVSVPATVYSAGMDANPGWNLEPQWQYGAPTPISGGPPTAFSGTAVVGYNLAGNYAKNLSTRYATTPEIDTVGSTVLTLRFMRWLRLQRNDSASIEGSINGNDWITVWSTSGGISDSTWVPVQYPLPPSLAGSSALRLRWGIGSNPDPKTDAGWYIDDVEILGDGAIDSSPPTASLSIANLSREGSPSHACSVTYADDTAVRLASIDDFDLVVVSSGGATNAVAFVGADLPMDGSLIIASYSISAPGGTWDAADNGSYTLVLTEGAVEDTLNNTTPQATLGSFEVDINPVAVVPLEIVGIRPGETVGIKLDIRGTPQSNLVLEQSPDLVIWTSLSTATLSLDGTLTLQDPDPTTLAPRFYRVRPIP